MAVTLEDIATALGRDIPDPDSLTGRQWTQWIDDALMLIEARPLVLDDLNQDRLDYVVREAVAAHVRRPDDSTSVEVSVDDGRVAKRYASASGRVRILDEWWDLLDPGHGDQAAFEINTAAESTLVHADTCALRFGAAYCSCGAVLTNALPIFGEVYSL